MGIDVAQLRQYRWRMGATDNLLVISPLLLSVSVVGVGLNLASLYIFTKQRYRKDFHRLLITLAAYDLLVSSILQVIHVLQGCTCLKPVIISE